MKPALPAGRGGAARSAGQMAAAACLLLLLGAPLWLGWYEPGLFIYLNHSAAALPPPLWAGLSLLGNGWGLLALTSPLLVLAPRSLLASVKLGGSFAFALIGNAVLVPVALFYLLMDWHRFVARALEFVPPRLRSSVDSFTQEADAVLGQYLRGQLLVMLLLAIFYSAGLAMFGLDLALPIGVFTGLAIFVPYLGFGLGLILATLAGLLEFASTSGPSYAFLMIAVVFGLGQLIESLFLTPRLVGERIGLHPLAVIFALLAFGQLFGFVGVLIALPASAVLLVAMRRARAAYLSSRLYQA